ncbi:MAG: HEPN domain-containing protein [Desulfobacterales bacterium]|jgi:uncharacterized protein (UPF0332 family)
MTLNDEDRELLINNYLEKSRTTIKKVEFLIDNNEYQLAVNRIYYGIYYSLSALAIKHQYSTSKHAQLIGWFNRTFVKTGAIEKEFSKMIRKAFENRMEGDYNVFADFSKEEVEQSLKEMKVAIQALDMLIKE